jgi:hypothetical protein
MKPHLLKESGPSSCLYLHALLLYNAYRVTRSSWSTTKGGETDKTYLRNRESLMRICQCCNQLKLIFHIW